MTIGWHFLYEGVWKYDNPDFSAKTFLMQAKGPLAPYFYALVPDSEGRERLDHERTLASWREYRQQFEAHYDLDEAQQQQVDRIFGMRETQLEDWFAENEEELDKHRVDLERLDEARDGMTIFSAPFQQKRAWDRQATVRSTAASLGGDLDAMERGLQEDLANILTGSQLSQGAPSRAPTQLERLDTIMTYGILAIGFCLVVGLFTRTAAVAGALFLLSVVLAQPAWPSIYPPAPAPAGHSLIVNKEFVEMIALAALATTAVGRWGGLDFFVHHLLIRPLFGRRGA